VPNTKRGHEAPYDWLQQNPKPLRH